MKDRHQLRQYLKKTGVYSFNGVLDDFIFGEGKEWYLLVPNCYFPEIEDLDEFMGPYESYEEALVIEKKLNSFKKKIRTMLTTMFAIYCVATLTLVIIFGLVQLENLANSDSPLPYSLEVFGGIFVWPLLLIICILFGAALAIMRTWKYFWGMFK